MKIIRKESPSLYLDFPLNSFFPISPLDPKGSEKAREKLRQKACNRSELGSLLTSYNRLIGNDGAAAEASLASFHQEGSVSVLTGQQAGLFGGPSYTILKAMSALLLAKKEGAVPIFWLATEDHDVEEIDHTFLLDPLGNIQKFHLSFPQGGYFVEDLLLNPSHESSIRTFWQAVGRPEIAEKVLEESSYSLAMAKGLAALFKGTGLLFAEPSLFRPLARGFFKKELLENRTIVHTLQRTAERLREAGGDPQFDSNQGTNLFLKTKKGFRKKIVQEGERFRVGEELFSIEELLEKVEKHPELFSTNAAARCALQNLLFPVLAYAAGPGELAYTQQLGEYHQFHGISLPWMVPRLSATFITEEAGALLESCRLNPWDPIPQDWNVIFPGIDAGVEPLAQEWLEAGGRYLGDALSKEVLARFVRFNVGALEKKAKEGRLKKKGVSSHALHFLANFLHPHQKLQERVFNWWQFQGHCRKENLVKVFLDGVEWSPSGHLYCYI